MKILHKLLDFLDASESGVSTSSVNARVWKSLNLIIIYESIHWKHCRQCAWKYTADALTFCSITFSNSLTSIHHTNSERHQNYIDIRRVFFFHFQSSQGIAWIPSIHSFRLQIVYLHYSQISNRCIEKKNWNEKMHWKDQWRKSERLELY